MVAVQPDAVTAELTILSDPPAVFSVTIGAAGPDRVVLSNAPLLPLAALVKLREGQRLWLGDIAECHPGAHLVIHVVNYLEGVDELSALADRFLGKRASERAACEAVTLS
jgi:hypothetical protein